MDELVHYGVKGMKWGVTRNAPNADYGKSQQAYDKKQYGRGGVKRINRRMNKGSDLQKARKQEGKLRARRGTAISLALLFAPQIEHGARVLGAIGKAAFQVSSQKVAVKAATKRGQAAAADAMGLPRQGSTGPNYNTRNRDGVYNISSI